MLNERRKETLSSTFGLSRATFQGRAAPGKTRTAIKPQQKLAIAGPVFFLRRSWKEARKCTAGFQSAVPMCTPREKLRRLTGKGKMELGGARLGMMAPEQGFGFDLEGLTG